MVGDQDGQYVDGLWTYAVPWAVYLMKTGDIAFVKDNFATSGPARPDPTAQHRGQRPRDRRRPYGPHRHDAGDERHRHPGPLDRRRLRGAPRPGRLPLHRRHHRQRPPRPTGPASSTKASSRAPTASSRRRSPPTTSTISPATSRGRTRPTAATTRRTRTGPRRSASAAGPGRPASSSAPVTGPGATLIDATYDYGFNRLKTILPPDTTGGFPGDYYSSAYNAAQGSAGLASSAHRDQGIRDFEFMIEHGQSGPWSWWESSSAPDPHSPWVGNGNHPATGQGSSPHAWGIAGSDKVLLDSIVAQRADGSVLVGRGVPPNGSPRTAPIAVTNFPTTDGKRSGFTIERPRHRRHPDRRRRGHRRQDPLRAPLVRRQRRVDIGRHRRPAHGHRHPGARLSPRHRHAAPRTVSSRASMASLRFPVRSDEKH